MLFNMDGHQDRNDFEISSLLNVTQYIDQTPLPTTEAAKALDIAERLRKQKVHGINQYASRWNFNNIRKAGGGSTASPNVTSPDGQHASKKDA